MAWVKLDDTFWSNRKLERLSDKGYRLYMRGLGYCSQYLTDGILDATDLRTLGATRKVIDELEDAGCWEWADGHYRVHDYFDFNPTREDVLERRRKAAEKKAEQRAKPNKHPETGRFTA